MFSLGEILKMQCQPTYQGFFKKKMWSKYSKIHLLKNWEFLLMSPSGETYIVFKS